MPNPVPHYHACVLKRKMIYVYTHAACVCFCFVTSVSRSPRQNATPAPRSVLAGPASVVQLSSWRRLANSPGKPAAHTRIPETKSPEPAQP